jgi:hypothetical protein
LRGTVDGASQDGRAGRNVFSRRWVCRRLRQLARVHTDPVVENTPGAMTSPTMSRLPKVDASPSKTPTSAPSSRLSVVTDFSSKGRSRRSGALSWKLVGSMPATP